MLFENIWEKWADILTELKITEPVKMVRLETKIVFFKRYEQNSISARYSAHFKNKYKNKPLQLRNTYLKITTF